MIARRENLRTLDAFNEAFNKHDVDAMMLLMTADCLFESTYPPPDGSAYRGQAAVRSYWELFFVQSPRAYLHFEDILVMGECAVQRWRYTWDDGHVRGVDVITFREGLIAEKLSYVKG
jgi:ketosteroid isomerase-like protein